MTRDDLGDLLEGLWRTNRERILGRLDDVERAVAAVAAGDAVDREAAAAQAHVLVGALGTYARPGSELLRQVEAALREQDGRAGTYGEDLAELARELRG